MKRLRLNNSEAGFIPMLICIFLLLIAGVVFVYLRVLHAQ